MSENRITVIVPARPGDPAECVESLRRQSLPVEVIVEEGTKPSEARNRGIDDADTEFVAFVNAHTIVARDWAESLVRFFESHPDIDMVGGPQLTPDDDPPFAKFSGVALASPFSSGAHYRRYRQTSSRDDADERSVSSANLACRRMVVEKVRFRPDQYPGEDPMFVSDVRKAGFRVAYAPNLVAFNRRRDSWSGLFRQIHHYGVVRARMPVELWMRNAAVFAPAGLVLYLAALPVLFWRLGWLAAIPLALYALLAALFALKEAFASGRPAFAFRLPVLFFWIHAAYGTGLIRGLCVRR